MAADKKTGRLAGVTAGRSCMRTVGKEGVSLTCRGYTIYDRGNNASVEEIACPLFFEDAADAGATQQLFLV